MKRNVITCDICGKEVSPAGYFTTWKWWYKSLVRKRIYHVCYDCKNSFVEWLKEREQNERTD